MKIIFYKGRKTLFSWLIYWFQLYFLKLPKNMAIYTHVEAFFDDKVMYSASERDGGVRGRYMPKFKDCWDFVDPKVSNTNIIRVRDFFEKRDGQKYDRAGIAFAQALNTNWFLNPSKWFCSEIVVASLQSIGHEKVRGVAPHMVSPADLYLMLTDAKK